MSNELDTSRTRRGGAWIGLVGNQGKDEIVRIETFEDINFGVLPFFSTANIFPWHRTEPNNLNPSGQNCTV